MPTLLCLLTIACDQLPFAVSAEESATRTCEERLQGELKSPSSYRRLWSSFTPAAPMTREEVIEKYEADRERAARAGSDAEALSSGVILKCLKDKPDCLSRNLRYEAMPHPKTAFILIQYEAANAFNAQLLQYYTCRMNVGGDVAKANVLTSTELSRQDGDRLKALSKTM